MIWIPNNDNRTGDGVSVVSHIEEVISENCVEALQLDRQQAAELASAVAMYVEQHEESGAYVDSGYLVMLTSRALSTLGEQAAAHRLLVFGSGLVRPAEWEVTGGDAIWTLDLRRMSVRDDVVLELVFFNSLNIILSSIAEVWDATEGHGVLGLRHVCTTASALLGGGKSRAVTALADEIRDACEAKLGQVQAERNWRYVPDIMNLDL